MPLNRFLLLLAAVIAAAGLTVALGAALAGNASAEAASMGAVLALALAVLWRLAAGRLR